MMNSEIGAEGLRMQKEEDSWRTMDGRTQVVGLTWAVRALVPALFVSTLPVRTRAVSYEGGRFGLAMGALITGGSLTVGWILYPVAGVAGLAVTFWGLGSAGLVMMVNAARPIAFVKPICTRCRLLPVIKEHEVIHMVGVEGDDDVWASMRTRHSCESLNLAGDPTICPFCPIPKRLKEK